MNYTKKNYIVFDNDDDLIEYAVNKIPLIENGYFTFVTSTAYNDDLEKGMKFVMRDNNSRAMINGVISYRTISIPISNMEYFDTLKFLGDLSDDDIIVTKDF